VCIEPWPSAGSEIENSDACTRASVLLEGEQKSSLPSEGSEQHATPCTPQLSPLPVLLLPPETLAHKIPRGEGTAPIRHATNECHLEVLKPPDIVIEDLGEAGGVPLAPSDAPQLPEGPECLGLVCVAIGKQELGGALAAMSVVIMNADAVKAAAGLGYSV